MTTVTLDTETLNKIVAGLSQLADVSAVGYGQELRILILEAEKKAVEAEKDALQKRVEALERMVRIQNGCEPDPCAPWLRLAALRRRWPCDTTTPLAAACADWPRAAEADGESATLRSLRALLARHTPAPPPPEDEDAEGEEESAIEHANSPLNVAQDVGGDEDLYS